MDKDNEIELVQTIQEKDRKIKELEEKVKELEYMYGNTKRELIARTNKYIELLEKLKDSVQKDEIIANKYEYENKCHVLRNEDNNYKWYEMGKNFGAVYALEELL